METMFFWKFLYNMMYYRNIEEFMERHGVHYHMEFDLQGHNK